MGFHSTTLDRKTAVLHAAIRVFGRYGYKKTSVDDIAEAAGISKQGLYLHFSSKEEIFVASVAKYLDDAVLLLDQALKNNLLSLHEKICEAMDVWFGRHYSTFSPQSIDVIEIGNQLSARQAEKYKEAFRLRVANALSESTEFKRSKNSCSPKEIASTLFTCGLTWKEHHESRADFAKKMSVCVKVCCQLKD
jgi:AcrR family transcriptional regulator